jgi:tetraacyldisaccharide 4'-kinase
LNEIKERFNDIAAKRKIMLTTEKDAVRLTKFSNELIDLPLYVLPVKHRFLFDDTEQFNQLVMDFVQNFHLIPMNQNE